MINKHINVTNGSTGILLTFLCMGSRSSIITVTRFGPKVGQIGPKLDKSGKFSDQIQYILAHRAGYRCAVFKAGVSNLASKWGQIGPKWDKSGNSNHSKTNSGITVSNNKEGKYPQRKLCIAKWPCNRALTDTKDCQWDILSKNSKLKVTHKQVEGRQ